MKEKMNCLKEVEIERLVLGATRVRKDERAHLLGCDSCRERFLALTAVYAPLLHGEKSMPKGTTTAPSFFEERVIVLLPLQREAGGSPVFRLAAKGGQPAESVAVLSFSDVEHGFVGRLLRDIDSRLNFYLLADDMQRTQGIQVILPDIDLRGVTDLQGCVDFGVQENFACSQVQVVSPLAAFTLQPLDPSAQKNREHHSFFLKNLEENEIEINITREVAEGQYRLSFKRIDGQPTLRELQVVAVTNLRTLETATERGIAVVQTDAPERLLKIHIY
jgi:hypothetical protein